MDNRIEKNLLFGMSGLVYISDFIPVDTSKTFCVRFEARSLNPSVLSKAYFVIDCYTHNRE